MSLSLTQLETFRVLEIEENYSRVAERLGLTQPAVSQQVRVLQQHFGVQLVDIVGRKAVLTDAGRFLAVRATHVLGNVRALEREMREFADVQAGELRVGATRTIGAYTLPSYLARFQRAYPGIRLSVIVENTATLIEALKSGHVSVALIEGIIDVDDDITIERYADDELVLITSLNHEFAQVRKPISPHQLASEHFILREEGSGTRRQVEGALAAVNVAPRIALSLPTGEGIIRAVALDIGVSIISRLVADSAVREGRIAQIPMRGVNLSRTLWIAQVRDQTQSPASRAFQLLLIERTKQELH